MTAERETKIRQWSADTMSDPELRDLLAALDTARQERDVALERLAAVEKREAALHGALAFYCFGTDGGQTASKALGVAATEPEQEGAGT